MYVAHAGDVVVDEHLTKEQGVEVSVAVDVDSAGLLAAIVSHYEHREHYYRAPT